jgi:capsular exopolysaccharide synthesis family protein
MTIGGPYGRAVAPVMTAPAPVYIEPDAPGTQFVTFGHVFQTLWRRKWVVVAVVFACTVAAAAIAWSQAAVYEGKALVEIQGVNENFLNKDIDPTAEGTGFSLESYIQTQIKILQTDRLLSRTANRLDLWTNPEFQPEPGMLARLRGLLRLGPSSGNPDKRHAVLSAMAKRLTVRLSGETHIVEVVFESHDPQLAAAVANALTEEYVTQNLEKRLSATKSMGQWLGSQLHDLRANLDQAELDLERYVTGHDLLYSSDADKDSVAEARLRQLQNAYSTAQEARITDQSQYELVGKVPTERLAEVVDNEAIRSYQAKLTELRQKFVEARALYTPAHYKVKQLQAEIDEVNRSLERERLALQGRLRSQYEASQRREKLLEDDMKSQTGMVRRQSANAVEYNTLKQSVETYRRLYDSTLQKAKETELASAIRANNVQIAESASVPDMPVRPAKPVYGGMGMLAGLIFGAVVALGRERGNRLVRGPGEIRGRLGIPELGPIPSAAIELPFSIKPRPAPLSLKKYYKSLQAPVEGDDLLRNWLELVTWRQPESILAESYRAALASLIHSAGAGSPRVIVFTSGCAGEGKTTVVANIAIALAESGRTVLLIDADRRRPRLHEIFRCSNAWGFGDYLLGHTPVRPSDFSRITHATEVPRLRVLPGGSDRSSVPNLVENRRAADLIEAARGVFDAVLIDTPPMLALSDARGLGRMADGVALVISSDRTPEQIVLAAAERLREDGIRVLGTILNNWMPGKDFESSYSEQAAYKGKR